jgi:RimJ/RimL family protein N-acetyltransferase
MAEFDTERLLIRPTREGDVEDVYLYMSDPEVMKYRACGALDREAVGQWVTRIVESGRSYQQFVGKVHQIVLRSSGRVIGYCYLDVPWPEGYRDLMTDGRFDFADLSYGLTRAHWGKGYATEAARAVMAHGFGVAGVEKIGAAVNPGNLASIRVLRRLAMEYRREIAWPGQGTVEFYSLSRGKYVQQRRG